MELTTKRTSLRGTKSRSNPATYSPPVEGWRVAPGWCLFQRRWIASRHATLAVAMTISALILTSAPLPSFALGQSAINFTLDASKDFEDVVVVTVSSAGSVGSEFAHHSLELTKENEYKGRIQGLYPTAYTLSHYIYKKDDPDKEPYEHPDYVIDYKPSFTIYPDLTYKMNMRMVSAVTYGVQTPTPEPPPPASPAPTPKPKKENFFPIHTFLFWTFVILVFAASVWYYIRKRKAFD